MRETRIADPKDKNFISLLNYILRYLSLDSIHEIAIGGSRYTMYQTITDEIILASGDMFMARAKDFNDALKYFSLWEKKNITKQNIRIVSTHNVENEQEQVEYVVIEGRPIARLHKDFFPKRFTKRSGVMAFGKRFYIAKKGPDGKPRKYTNCVYSWNTRLLVFSHEDRDICEMWIRTKYKDISHKDTIPKEHEDE